MFFSLWSSFTGRFSSQKSSVSSTSKNAISLSYSKAISELSGTLTFIIGSNSTICYIVIELQSSFMPAPKNVFRIKIMMRTEPAASFPGFANNLRSYELSSSRSYGITLTITWFVSRLRGLPSLEKKTIGLRINSTLSGISPAETARGSSNLNCNCSSNSSYTVALKLKGILFYPSVKLPNSSVSLKSSVPGMRRTLIALFYCYKWRPGLFRLSMVSVGTTNIGCVKRIFIKPVQLIPPRIIVLGLCFYWDSLSISPKAFCNKPISASPIRPTHPLFSLHYQKLPSKYSSGRYASS